MTHIASAPSKNRPRGGVTTRGLNDIPACGRHPISIPRAASFLSLKKEPLPQQPFAHQGGSTVCDQKQGEWITRHPKNQLSQSNNRTQGVLVPRKPCFRSISPMRRPPCRARPSVGCRANWFANRKTTFPFLSANKSVVVYPWPWVREHARGI